MQSDEFVEVIIAPDGTITAEAHGIKGAACEQVVKDLLKGYGETVREGHTEEFYEKPEDGRARVKA